MRSNAVNKNIFGVDVFALLEPYLLLSTFISIFQTGAESGPGPSVH